MEPILVILGIVAIMVLCVLVLVVKGYYPVPQGHAVLIERFGQFHRKLESGINIIIPGLDIPVDLSDWQNTANKPYRGRRVLVELSEQFTDTGPRSAVTKDNVELQVDGSVYWQIVDPVRARYEVDHLPPSVLDMALNVLRTAVGMVTLDQALSERTKINQYLLQELTKACDKWGVRVVRVEIQSLKPQGAEVGAAMSKEMSAERDRRAIVLKAKGDSESKLLLAQAERDAKVIRAQGEAQAAALQAEAELARIEKLASRFGDQQGLQAAIILTYLETLSHMAKDPAAKLFLPANGQLSTPYGSLLADMLTNRSQGDLGLGSHDQSTPSVAITDAARKLNSQPI